MIQETLKDRNQLENSVRKTSSSSDNITSQHNIDNNSNTSLRLHPAQRALGGGGSELVLLFFIMIAIVATSDHYYFSLCNRIIKLANCSSTTATTSKPNNFSGSSMNNAKELDKESKMIHYDDEEENSTPLDNPNRDSNRQQGVIFDEPINGKQSIGLIIDEEEDENEDELEEDPEEFYSTNPVDQGSKRIKLLEGDLNKDDDDLRRMRFNDFDRISSKDIELNFYGDKAPNKNRNNHRKRAHQKNVTSKRKHRPPLRTTRRELVNKVPSIEDASSHDSRSSLLNYSHPFPLKNHHHLPNKQQPEASASVRNFGTLSFSGSNNQNSQVNCALYLSRGGCITYDDVEDAAQNARVQLRFQVTGSQLRAAEPSEATINAVGQLNELTTRLLARRFRLNWLEVATELEQIDIRRTTLWADCPIIFRVSPLCTMMNRYRTHTGLCNNPLATHLGSTNMPFLRMLPGDYGDGVGTPRRATLSRRPLPPARLVALQLHPTIENPSSEHSSLFMSWGQLINHDVAMASGARGEFLLFIRTLI